VRDYPESGDTGVSRPGVVLPVGFECGRREFLADPAKRVIMFQLPEPLWRALLRARPRFGRVLHLQLDYFALQSAVGAVRALWSWPRPH